MAEDHRHKLLTRYGNSEGQKTLKPLTTLRWAHVGGTQILQQEFMNFETGQTEWYAVPSVKL